MSATPAARGGAQKISPVALRCWRPPGGKTLPLLATRHRPAPRAVGQGAPGRAGPIVSILQPKNLDEGHRVNLHHHLLPLY